MVRWHWVCLLFCLKSTSTPCQSLTGEGICAGSNGTMMHCCTGYIQMGDTCVECEPGYRGINCSSACPQNYYGRLCRERCDCDSDKYCDSILGCLCKNNSVNCTDQHQDQEETSVGVTDIGQSNSRDTIPRRALLFPLLIVVTCITVLAVGGRIWYSKTTKKKDFAVRDEDDGVQNDASREVYNHLNLRVRLSNTSFFHTRRGHGADREPSLVLCQESPRLSPSQLTEDMARNTITDGQGGTTIVPHPCGEDVASKPIYPNAIRSLQQTVFNTDIPPHTTWSDTDVSYFNLGHSSCPSGGDIRPDSTVSSEASEDLYFDVSYAGQLALSVDKFDVSSSPTQKQESCKTDAVLLTKHFARRKSETEMSSFLRRSTESVCSEKKGEHFSLTETRPDSLTASEASDDLYFDVSYAGQLALSVDKFDVSSSPTQKQESCKTDAVLLTKHFARRKSETEMSSFLRRSTESVCSEKKGEHFSLTETRPDSLTASEASDELYFDVSYLGLPTNSCVQGGTDSLSSSCSSQFRQESSDYINCSDLV